MLGHGSSLLLGALSLLAALACVATATIGSPTFDSINVGFTAVPLLASSPSDEYFKVYSQTEHVPSESEVSTLSTDQQLDHSAVNPAPTGCLDQVILEPHVINLDFHKNASIVVNFHLRMVGCVFLQGLRITSPQTGVAAINFLNFTLEISDCVIWGNFMYDAVVQATKGSRFISQTLLFVDFDHQVIFESR